MRGTLGDMARYLNEEQAISAGFRIEHEAEKHRFVVVQTQDVSEATTVGEAHYTLLGESGIDFDHTLVDPSLRGTGLAGLLAQRALTDEVVRGRKIQASCWFIAEYLEKHPHLAETGA